jgi:Secretion system C-terminal sorting domain
MKPFFTSLILSICLFFVAGVVYAQPANDDCAGAITITVQPFGATCAASVAAVTTGATQSAIATSCAPTSSNDDVWYSFTATASTHYLRYSNFVRTSGTAGTQIGYTLYSGTCAAPVEIGCELSFGTGGGGSVPLTGLTAGTTYLLRLFASSASNSATFNFCVQEPAPTPANDECADAVPLTQGGACATGTTAGASHSLPATTCTGTADDDVWFSFTANTTDAQVVLSSPTAVVGSSTTLYFQVLSGDCSSLTSLRCFATASGVFGGLNPGETYYIRVYTSLATSQVNFNICVNELATAPTTCGTLSAPAANAVVSETPTLTWNTATNATAYEIYLDGNSPPTTLYTTVTNGVNSYTVTPPLASGDYYWYVRATNSVGTSATDCSLSARKFTVVAPPANNECATATALTVNTDQTCTAITSGTTVGATESLAACTGSGADDDVWFSFVATATGHKIKLSNVVATSGTSVDMVHQIFSGSCGTLTSLYCTDSPDSTLAFGLTPGETYYVRVFTYSTANRVTFDICATTLPTPPANDDCASAITITTEAAGSNCVANIAASTTGAAPSAITETSCTTTSDNDDIFYSFTATGTSQIIRFSNMVATAGTATVLGYHIFNGTCGTLTQLPSCDISFGTAGAGSSIITGLTIGQVYYLQLFTGGTNNTATFNFCVQDVVPPPANDDCAGAINVITQAFSASCTNPVAAVTTGSTASAVTETSCTTTSDNDDIWYSFTATAISQKLQFSNMVATIGTATALGYHIFSGSCGALTQLSSCSSTFGSGGAGNTIITGLTIGSVYYLRLFTAAADNTATFDFCIQDVPVQVNDECAGALAMPVTPNGTTCTPTAVNTTGATLSTNTGQAACTTTSTNDDVFYTFTSTIAGIYTFSFSDLVATTGTATTLGMHVYTGACGALVEVTGGCDFGFGSAGSGSRTVTLAAGTTYTLRLWTGSTANSGTFNFCITAPAPPPANDECAGAITVTTQPYNATCVSSTAATTNGAGASAVTETSCVTTNDNDDIFYTFTATATTQVLRFSNMVATLGTATTLGYQVFSGSCAGLTQLASCNTGFGSAGSGSTFITGLTINTVYYLRLFTGGTANSATFDFCIQDNLPAPSNDDCANAITVATQPFNPTCVSSTAAVTSGATQSGIVETSCTTTSDNDDIYYSFTATGTSQILRFSNMVTTFNTATTLGYQVFDACGGTQLTSCSTGFGSGGAGSTTITGLTSGNTYVLRLFTGGADNTATFDFCIQDLAPQPANDECATAIAITIQPFSPTCTAEINATTNGSSASVITETSCTTTSDNDDIFYTFTATSSSQILRFSNMVAGLGTATTLGYQVFTGACPGTQITSCSAGFGSGGAGNTTITGLTAGTSYTLRLFTGGTLNSATFDFCLQEMPSVPANDECATAISIATQPYGTICSAPISATTNGATASVITETSCVTTSDNDDIFYSFTAAGTSQILNFSNLVAGVGTATQLGYQVFAGACPGTQITSCSTGFGTSGAGSTIINGLTVGTTYTLRLFAAGTSNSASFDFCIQNLPPVPSNDECAAATVLTNGVSGTGNTLSATQSIAPETCGTSTASSAVDVWYQFTALSSGSALITVNEVSTALDAVIQVYSGSCGTLTNIGCADGPAGGGTETATLNGLVAGQTYYFRVYGFNAGAGQFTVTVSGAALPITIEYFRGSKQVTGNLLQWRINCSGSSSASMIIERSQDARRFTAINSITATAARCLEAFTFTDATPAAGTNYYRLKSVDADGKISYSSTIAILNKAKGFEIVNLIPNPVQSVAILNLNTAFAGKVNIIVSDVEGRQLQVHSMSMLVGNNQQSLDLSKLSAGLYYLTAVTADGEKRTVKFLKVKQ